MIGCAAEVMHVYFMMRGLYDIYSNFTPIDIYSTFIPWIKKFIVVSVKMCTVYVVMYLILKDI